MVAAVAQSPSSALSGSASTEDIHVVEHGDTLSKIAREAGVPLSALLAANPQIANPDRIYVGDRIHVPAGAAAPSVAAAAPAGGGANALSEDGLSLIKGFEGLRLTAYQDSVGVWTIGYGHTAGVRPGDQITQAQADEYLRQDTGWAQQAVRNLVTVPLSQGQFDALTSFTFNLGAGALEGSTLLAKLNSGDYAGAQAEFGRWVHADGQVLQGLVNRRATEAELFGSQAPGGGQAPDGSQSPAPAPAPSAPGGDYTVRPGDTLWDLARQHGVSLQALIAANPQIANPDLIHPGQSIHLPGGAFAGQAQPAQGGDHTVQPGDTLWALARQYGASLHALIAANPQIANPDLIHPGQTVHLPGGASVPPPSTQGPSGPSGPSAPSNVNGVNSSQALADAARSVALSMGGYSSQSLCATGVSRAIENTYGVKVWGNGNDIDDNLPRDRFQQIDIPLSEALKIPGLVLTWEQTSTAAGQIYGHTAITLGDGHSSASDFIENDTLAAEASRTGLKIFMPI